MSYTRERLRSCRLTEDLAQIVSFLNSVPQTLDISSSVKDLCSFCFKCREFKHTMSVNARVANANSKKIKPPPIKTYDSSSSTSSQ